MTRPDIANAVRAVARQAHDPAERHWRGIRKIIAYLNKTKDLGFVFDDTSYCVTVGLSNTVQLRLFGNYSVMLELLESLLCCLTWHFFFLLPPSSFLFFFSSSGFSGCNKHVIQPPRVKPYGIRPIQTR